MSTGEGPSPRDDHGKHEEHNGRGDRIGIGSGDDAVTRIQLAARWAEVYGPHTDSLAAILKRFRAAYEYLDAVTHGVEPSDLERDVGELSRPLHQSSGAPSAAAEPASAPIESAPTSSLPPAPSEPRAWS